MQAGRFCEGRPSELLIKPSITPCFAGIQSPAVGGDEKGACVAISNPSRPFTRDFTPPFEKGGKGGFYGIASDLDSSQ